MKPRTVILPEILESNLLALQELCTKHRVQYLWVFGSVLTDDFTKDSDIDFLYTLDEKNLSDEEYLDNYYSLEASLKKLMGRNIDFVHYPSLKNPYFLKSVEATKILLYAQRPEEVPL